MTSGSVLGCQNSCPAHSHASLLQAGWWWPVGVPYTFISTLFPTLHPLIYTPTPLGQICAAFAEPVCRSAHLVPVGVPGGPAFRDIMCRLPPLCAVAPVEVPPCPPGLDAALLDEGDLDWLAALNDDLTDEELEPLNVITSAENSSGNTINSSMMLPRADTRPSPSSGASGSYSSVFDLVSLYHQPKQEMDAAAAPQSGGDPGSFLSGSAVGGATMPAVARGVGGGALSMNAAVAAAVQQQQQMLAAQLAATADMAAASQPPAHHAPAVQHAHATRAALHETMGSPPVRKPGRSQRTQAEIDAAVERIKQKRRESAHRSRQRRNDYMHMLELENAALKDEVGRLQAMLAAMQQHSIAAYSVVGI